MQYHFFFPIVSLQNSKHQFKQQSTPNRMNTLLTKLLTAFRQIAKLTNKKVLLTTWILFLSYHIIAQPINAPQTFPNNIHMSTGVNSNGTAILNPNQNDLRWKVSSNIFGGYVPALICTPANGWELNSNTSPNIGAWICPPYYSWPYPGMPCNNGTLHPANHSCITTPSIQFAYYKIEFNLPTYTFAASSSGTVSPAFALNWYITGDDKVDAIYVNQTNTNTPSWTPGSMHGVNNYNSGVFFRYCSRWIQGVNTVIIRTRSTVGFTGIKVLSYANSPMTIVGPTITCPAISNTYITNNFGNQYQYNWVKPAGWTGSSLIPNIVSTSSQNSGLMQVSYQNTLGCLGAGQITLTVPPPLTITPNAPSVCRGSVVSFTGSGAQSYTWVAPGNIPFSYAPTATTVLNATSTFTLRGKTSLGCLYTRTLQVLALPVPSITIASATNQICSGSNVVLVAQGNAIPSYTWLSGANNPTMASAINVKPQTTTTYTLRGRLNNGCTNTKTFNLQVNPTPTLTAVANPSVVCQGVSSTLTASANVSINGFTWQPGSSTHNSLVVTPNNSFIYMVQANSTSSCFASQTVMVHVLSNPTVNINPPFICQNITNTLTASGANSYTWQIGGSVNTTITGPPTITLNLQSTTPFTVCGTGANNCTACATYTLNHGPSIPFAVPDITLCTNGGPCITNSITTTYTPAVSYTWLPGTNLTGSVVSICPNSFTTYTVTATSTAGCPTSVNFNADVISNCCPQSTVGLTHLDPGGSGSINGNFTNGTYFLDAPVTLNGTTLFQDMDIWMTENAKIFIDKGADLELDHAHLFACGINMWQGIEIIDGGAIFTDMQKSRLKSSMIEDAHVGINLDKYTATNSSIFPPIDIQRVIFNKNYIGIKITDTDPSLDSLALGINGCLFSSRQITFNTFPNPSLDWPDSDNLPNTLRFAAPTATTGLFPPYNIMSFSQTNIKQPYNSLPGGHIGIKIENFGNPSSYTADAGVQIGMTYTGAIVNDFNLFDGLGAGIDITNGGFTAANNVFQNMLQYPSPSHPLVLFGGYGIRHDITDDRNSRLAIKSLGDEHSGNRFWNCNTAVLASNVNELWVSDAIIRSTHQAPTYGSGWAMPGDTGISFISNRPNLTVRTSQFNNLTNGLVFNTPPVNMPFLIPNFGSLSGIYMQGIVIEHNYFGPQVLSSTPYNNAQNLPNQTEYSSDAIKIMSHPGLSWNWTSTSSANNWIVTNRIDRTFRGIYFEDFNATPMAISGNSLYIEDDFTTGLPGRMEFGYGIAGVNTWGNLTISANTLQAMSPIVGANTVSLVYCDNNLGMFSPSVTCNQVKSSNYGFQFNGDNSNAQWHSNLMCDNYAGLALTNSAVIGPQGDPQNACGNVWEPWTCQRWAPFILWQTLCDNSDPNQSPLFVVNTGACNPIHNGSIPLTSQGYQQLVNIDDTPTNILAPDCYAIAPYILPPSWRQSNAEAGITNIVEEELENLAIYPNPTNGALTIKTQHKTQTYTLSLHDVNGRLLLNEAVSTSGEHQMDVKYLEAGIYFLTIKNTESQSVVRKKIIKTN